MCSVVRYNQSTNHKQEISGSNGLISQQTMYLLGCAVEPINRNRDVLLTPDDAAYDMVCKLSCSAFLHCIALVARPYWSMRKRFSLHKASLRRLRLIKSSEGDGIACPIVDILLDHCCFRFLETVVHLNSARRSGFASRSCTGLVKSFLDF